MKEKTSKRKRRFVLLFILFFSSTEMARAHLLTCYDNKIYRSGTSTTPKEAKRMLTDASFPENRKLASAEKIRRVKAHINKTVMHKRPKGISIENLAHLIVEISDCSGHDFSIFAGLLKKESTYCLEKLNKSSKKSTASGCGQMTIWPVREFKNHLRLPGWTKAGDPDAKEAILTLINRCIPDRKQDFMELFSLTPSDVKAYLRNSDDYEMDLFVSALYLKFQYGQRGFYYNPHSRAPGALSEYGEGSGYAGLIDGFAQDVRNSNQICFDETKSLKEIEETSCELSEDLKACALTTNQYEI